MKLKHLAGGRSGKKAKTIASFGGARLVQRPDGQYEVLGGSKADRTEVKEWISLFEHDVLVTLDPPAQKAHRVSPLQALCETVGCACIGAHSSAVRAGDS
jgi:hypothetical protein